jgi:hypothetical protein
MPSPRRTQVVALVMLVIAAAVVALLALRTRQPPLMPADPAHAAFAGAESCLGACHGPDGGVPRSRNHPLGQDCLRCHGAR